MTNGTRFAWLRWLAAAGGLLGALALLSPPASAVVVHQRNGHFLGVAPKKGVKASSIRGSVAAQNQALAPSSSGSLSYHNGPVLHSSNPYLIFWVPSGESFSSTTKSLLERYFTDVAAASGGSSDVYGVDRQFTDGSGFADYAQTFTAASQSILDTHAYPATDTANCVNTSAPAGDACITDAQLQTEVERLISADGLPTGTGANAPIYFVVFPTDVNECFDSSDCADTTFCAYHSNLTDGANNVLYGAIPTFLAATDPKGCQFDNNTAVQAPNADPVGDVTIKYLSHEDNETITDPLGTGWWNSSSGNEDGDECNFYGTPANPAKGQNPDAFAPTLGGSASAGTLYDQLIASDPYYIQSEWSNGDSNCELRPTSGTITPSFTEPAGPNAVGSSLTFNPSASASTNSISSETWSFGDGSASTFHAGGLASVSHTYSVAGTYTVKLTLVDDRGNITSTSQSIAVYTHPVASFTSSPPSPGLGTAVGFDGSGSSDPDPGVTITSYAWTFGDGATGSGQTASHTYTAANTYTVSLQVTNSVGLTSTISHQVTVTADESPSAAFTFSPSSPTASQSVSFDGSSSADPDGSISSYHWNFGDGATGNGASPTHAYTNPGTYTVALTVTDSSNLTDTVSHQVTVAPSSTGGPPPIGTAASSDEAPTAAFTVKAGQLATGQPESFDGIASSDPDGSIATYAWQFGDGTGNTGPKPSHTYRKPGVYTVTLVVVDSSGHTAVITHTLTVVKAAITRVSLKHKTVSGATIFVTVNAPGTVSAGGKRTHLTRQGTAKLKLVLANGQHLKIRFAPSAGSSSSRTISVEL